MEKILVLLWFRSGSPPRRDIGWLSSGDGPGRSALPALVHGIQPPGGQRPGKEQDEHEKDGIAISLIEGIRLRQQLGGSAYKRCPGNHQEASEQVEAHHEAHAENENAEKDQPRQKLFDKVSRAAPAPANHRKRANQKQQNAKPGRLEARGNE